MAFGGRRCEQHRDALLDFADTREIRPATAAALEHLSRCSVCARELEITALAIVGLRRLYDDVRAIEPPGDAWDRLRTRISGTSTPHYSLRSPVMGMVVALSMVAAMGLRLVALPTTHHTVSAIGAPDPSRDRLEPMVARVRFSVTTDFESTSIYRPPPDGAREPALTAAVLPLDDEIGARKPNLRAAQ
jgi:hypothetical protein